MSAEKDATVNPEGKPDVPQAEVTGTTASASGPATLATPFAKFAARLPIIVKECGYNEMWGVDLQASAIDDHVPTKVIVQKFLRANNDDPSAAEQQLTEALWWRKKFNPTKLVGEVFDEEKYAGLGYVTVHPGKEGERETVITWNIYGAVKDNKKTFGDVEDFIKWRAALMELGVQKLNLSDVKEPLKDGEPDPYQMIQVHDYLSVSFFKMDPHVKAASQQIIKTFGMAYPELLAHKYFVNVPMVMGWMYAAMKLFLAPATLKKFHPMSSGKSLALEMPDIKQDLPQEYGGAKGSLQEVGEVIRMKKFDGDVKKEEVAPTSEEAPVAAVKEGDKPQEDVKAEEAAKVQVDTEPKAEDAPVAAVKEGEKPAEEIKTPDAEKKDAA